MYGAALLCHQEGYLEKEKVKRLEKLIKKAGLPTKLSELPTELSREIDTEELIKLMHFDWKVDDGNIVFVYLKDFGDSFISPAKEISLRKVLQKLK